MKTISDLITSLAVPLEQPLVRFPGTSGKAILDLTAIWDSVPGQEIAYYAHCMVQHRQLGSERVLPPASAHDSAAKRGNLFFNESLGLPYLHTRYYLPLRYLVAFLTEHPNAIDSLRHIDDRFRAVYRDYLTSHGLKWTYTYPLRQGTQVVVSGYAAIVSTVYWFFVRAYEERLPPESDLWDLSDLGVSPERKNHATPIDTIHFLDIANEYNKTLLKEYMQHVLQNTDRAIQTLLIRFYHLKRFVIWLDETNIRLIGRPIAEAYFGYLNKLGHKDKAFNGAIYPVIDFVNHLIIKGHLDQNPFYLLDIKGEGPYRLKISAVEPGVVRQIYSVLDKVDPQLSCMFLLIHSTGMRASEVCTIKRDGIYQTDTGCFVRYYQPKLRKEVVNPIPPALYERLLEQSQRVVAAYSENESFMFRTPRSSPCRTIWFRNNMQRVCDDYGICLESGERYLFSPHDFRHSLGTEMADRGISLPIIQRVLHHESPEMTLSYIERSDDKKRRRYYQLLNNRGEAVQHDATDSDDLRRLKWLKENLNAQALPNGFCGVPVIARKCPHANACLVCEHFLTNASYLAVHRQQLARTEQLLELAREKQWTHLIETNEAVRANLINLITKIEAAECDHSCGDSQ